METPGGSLRLTVPRSLVGCRFDVVATELLRLKAPGGERLTRGEVARSIRSGAVSLNGRKQKAGQVIGHGDRIEAVPEVWVERVSPSPVPDNTVPLDILAENDQFVVVNKRAGILVHPAGQSLDGTLVSALLSRCPSVTGVGENPLRPGIVHRLDRETSGVMVIAKVQASYLELKNLFQVRAVDKAYLALVWGHLPAFQGVIERPLARQSGSLKRRVLMSKDQPAVVSRSARTEYRVLARSGASDVVLVLPRTGRTHQIRAHLAALGHPVLGDRLYANKSMRTKSAVVFNRHMLHAWKLSFTLNGHRYAYSAPLPEDMLAAIRISGPWVLSPVDENTGKGYDTGALKELFSD